MRIAAPGISATAAVFSARSLPQFALFAAILAPAFLSLPACQAIEPYLVAAPVVELPPDDSKWRPFGQNAKLPDPGGPAQSQQSTIVPGTGVFVGSTKPVRADRRDGDQRGYTLNLVNATIPEAARAVLGDIFGVNYIVDPKLDARVTVQTSQPLNRAGIGELFETALRTNGIAVVQTGNVYRVVTADQAAMGAQLSSGGGLAGPQLIGNSAKVVQLQYISPVEMKRILDPLASFGGVVRVDDARNALVITGTEQEITSMEEAIAVFDVDVMRGMSFAIVPVSAVEPDAIVDDLTKIFSSNREGPMAGMVQFIANKRLKSILVISKQPKYLRQADQWVRRLDARAVGTQRQFYTYVLRNRQAKEVVEILHSIFATETASGDQAGRGDVAPRFRRATAEGATTQGQPAPQFSTSASPSGSQTLVQQSFSAFGVNPRQPSASRTGAPTDEEGGVTAAAGIVPDPDGEPRIKLVADVPNNALVIRATQADYKRVERVIANLDIVPNQVLIEATICEVTLTDDLKFGVRWFVRSKGGTQAATFTSALDGAISSVFPGFSWIYKAGSTQVTLNALNTLTRVNVLASPALMVLDGRTASLQIGDQVPITTQTATSVITPGAPIVNSVSYKDTGVILAVTPRINEAGRVLLEIEQEVSSVTQTTSSNIDSPTFGRRRVKTTVLVNDGEAVTLGGLIQNKKTFTADQVPVLGNIPFIGNAFKDKDDKVEKTELIILLTPKVVRDMTEAQQVTSEYRRKVGEFAPRRRDPVRQFEHDVKRTLQ